jgi:hypothetical protein
MGLLKRLGRFIDGLFPEEKEETLKYGQKGEAENSSFSGPQNERSSPKSE